MRWTAILLCLAACSAEVASETPSDVRAASVAGPPPAAPPAPALEATPLAFRDRDAFSPLPDPGPDDWLAQHSERGQSFERYLSSPLALPDTHRTKIYVQPIGSFEPGSPSLELLERVGEAYFELPLEFLPKVDESELEIRTRRHHGERQLHAGTVLQALRPRVPEDARVLLAVTMSDLYPDEEWNFVFGQASLSDRVGVFSFARYDPAFYDEPRGPETDQLVLERASKVMLHELGHAFGLEHCIDYLCLMNGSNHLEEADNAPLHVCPRCLRKLQHSIGFEPLERYEGLASTYEEVGLDEAAAFARARVEELAPAAPAAR